MLFVNLLFACHDPGLRRVWLPVLLVANAVFIPNQHTEISRWRLHFEEVWIPQPPPPSPRVAVTVETVKTRVREDRVEGPPSWLEEERNMPYWPAIELEERRRQEHEERMKHYGAYFN